MMSNQVIFNPLVPMWVLTGAAGLVAVIILWAMLRRLSGWPLRGLAGAALILALANPSLQSEDRQPLTDIALVVVDETASQTVANRPDQIALAEKHLTQALAARPNTETRFIRVPTAPDDGGSLVMSALAQALAEEPKARIAGAFVITDGQVHDPLEAPTIDAPLHVLLTGEPQDWDRRLVVKNAPSYAILGEPLVLTLRLEDQGAAPAGTTAELSLSIDGDATRTYSLPINQDVEIEVELAHGGMNVLHLTTPFDDSELTDRNNAAVVQVNAVRDRLRVLLVSGEPHPGERTWRNLLKSDSSVDLVHFTILRPPGKQGNVPITELSLIAFPTRELFLEKIDEFDLIIFDRYKRRGILPGVYFLRIVQYVQDGGAVLVAAGPDYASADSLYRSPLADVIPGIPTARVFEEGLMPTVSDTGLRHPVTSNLMDHAGPDGWGRWMRQVEIDANRGDVLMTGKDDLPLLLVDRVGKGRTALLASDHAWLWDRGFEGGGPQGELLRRLAHWMMKEPELEEDALSSEQSKDGLTFTRRSLDDLPDQDLTVIGPDGQVQKLQMAEVSPGQYQAILPGAEVGLYRASQGDFATIAAVGPSAPREFIETIASGDRLSDAVVVTNGGIINISDGLPRLRDVKPGRPAHGRGWLGLTSRDAFATQSVTLSSLLPAWVYVLLAAGLLIGAWIREGRRVSRA